MFFIKKYTYYNLCRILMEYYRLLVYKTYFTSYINTAEEMNTVKMNKHNYESSPDQDNHHWPIGNYLKSNYECEYRQSISGELIVGTISFVLFQKLL